MTIQEAIKLAIENGWKSDRVWTNRKVAWKKFDFLLYPLFWQALGRGMGWDEKLPIAAVHAVYVSRIGWQEMWHRLIDHLAEGKSIESFFETL